MASGSLITMLPDFDDCDMDAEEIFLLRSPGSSTSGYFSTDDETLCTAVENKLQDDMEVDLLPLESGEVNWHVTLQKRLNEDFSIRTPLRRSESLDFRKKLFQSQNSPFTAKQPKRGNTLKRPLTFSPKKKIDRPSPAAHAECRIKAAVETLASSEMIADGSKTYILPTVPGKHKDLQSISPKTLSDLLSGHYTNDVDEYAVVDCRYPYEYNGGHIQSAVSLFTFDDVSALLEKAKRSECCSQRRRIIIFHCEFSSHRAPGMMRHLRSLDRAKNSDRYPYLFFPEIYLLEGGYNIFYEQAEELCEPKMYTPMLHKDHSSDLRHFRQKAKSWTAGEKRKTMMRSLRF